MTTREHADNDNKADDKEHSTRVAGLGSTDLEAEIVLLTGRLAAATYELLVLIGEYDHRGTWAATGALSSAAWLASVSDIDLTTAHNLIRVARAMRERRSLASAMANGDVSYPNARVLTASITTDNAGDLIDIATRTPAGRLGAAIAAWLQRHEDPTDTAARQEQLRSCTWHTYPDGLTTITARLTPETAAAVRALIDATVKPRQAPAGATLVQLRADALVQLATRGDGKVNAEVLIHVDAQGNTLDDGTPLTDNAVPALLPDAFVRLLIHGSRRRPIDASPRRRTPTLRQRRVIDARHHQCAHPGCTATVFLQYDHIHPYAKGGTTTLDNVEPLRGPHSRARRDRRDRQERTRDG